MSCTRAPKLTFDKVFATLDQFGEGALVIGADAFFDGQSERLAALAVRQPLLLLLRILVCRSVTVGRLNRLFYSAQHCEALCKPST
jgi:hypothetical protein